MAETPKDETKTGTDAPESVTAAPMEATDAPEGGGASPAEDSIASGSANAAVDTLDTGTISADAAADHVTGGEGGDGLSDAASAETPGRPWSRPETTDAEPSLSTPDSTPAKPAAKSGGGGRIIVLLILIVLVAGAGYATYPDWRDQARPYAEAVGINLPEVPVEPDDPADAQAQGDATASVAPVESEQSDAAAGTAPAQEDASPAQGVVATDVDALAVRVSAAEAAIDRLSDAEPAAPAGLSDDLSALAERVEALESRLATVGDELSILRQGLGDGDTSAGVAEATTALTGRLADLDARLSALEQATTAPSVTPEDLAAVSARIDTLTAALDTRASDLASQLDTLDDAQRSITDKLSQGRNAQEQAGAFLLASNLLAAASAGSGPFSAELNAVETAADPAAADAVATLKAHADGVPSQTDLRARFPAVAASIIDASVVGADGGVLGTALTRIASLVTLRRTETAEGDAIDAIVNRAEAATNAGDLTAAVDALASLDGDPAKVAASWLEQARARIAVDEAVRALQSQALSAVSGS